MEPRTVTCRPSSGRNFRRASWLRKQTQRICARGVLEREIEMAGLGGVGVGDFALDENVGELAGQQIADARGEVADRPDGAARASAEAERVLPWAKFRHDFSRESFLSESFPEIRDQPHQERKHDAQQEAGDNRKIERTVPAADGDIAGQTSEAQRETAPEQQEPAEGKQDEAAEDQPFCEFTCRVHWLPACLALSWASSPEVDCTPYPPTLFS